MLTGGVSGKESTCNAGDVSPRVRSLGREDSLEEEMATHSRILRESHGQRNPVGCSPWVAKSRTQLSI